MIYALTTPCGRVFEFYIKSCAELYHSMYGGTLGTVDTEVLHDTCSMLTDCDQLELL
jgi:hypothetical protein